MIQNGLVSAMLKWPLGRADFHVRHGASVRQFIEVAQKFAGEVSTKLSTNCSDSAVTVYWQITLQSGTCRIVCRTFLANFLGGTERYRRCRFIGGAFAGRRL